MIEILDTTLRDGGYVNNWNFAPECAKGIIDSLIKADVEYIECGFLKDSNLNDNSTLFSSVEQFENIINKPYKYALMINYGEYDLNKLPDNKNLIIRIAFKKDKLKDIIPFAEYLKLKGCAVSLNPCATNTYTDGELKNLIEISNEIEPFCLTIVDTMGNMGENEVVSKFNLVNSMLKNDIKIGFHFHNNLQTAFTNAKTLVSICKNRDLIIDSTLFGMGRSSGNLCSELILQYLKSEYNKNYDLKPVLEAVEKYIYPIYQKTPWGYSIYYYLSAINKCHPNYAKYLKDRNISFNLTDEILKRIPDNAKSIYNEKVIREALSPRLLV